MHGTLPEIDPVSVACQRWWQGRHSWVRRSHGGFDPGRYLVTDIDEATAKTYIRAHHYLKSYPAAVYRFGFYLTHHPSGGPVGADGPRLVWVAVFAVPVSARVLTGVFPDLVPYTESLELARFVLDGEPVASQSRAAAIAQAAPANAETWFLARCRHALAARGVRESCRSPTWYPAG